jgi:hypothetical protein
VGLDDEIKALGEGFCQDGGRRPQKVRVNEHMRR